MLIYQASTIRKPYALEILNKLNSMGTMSNDSQDLSFFRLVRNLNFKVISTYLMGITLLSLLSVDKTITKKSMNDILLNKRLYGMQSP